MGVDPSTWREQEGLSAVSFVGGMEEFSMSWYDTGKIGTPQLLAQFSDRMVAQMRKTENNSNIRLMFYIRSLECLLGKL